MCARVTSTYMEFTFTFGPKPEFKFSFKLLRISNQVIHSEQIDIKHVFDRFYKADAARSKTSTGLGLSIAREFVKRMNGEIGAKIEKNEFIVEMSFPIIKDGMEK
mgnify:CR=1 FL=1